MKEKIKLTKREYLGVGYVHHFKNIKTNEDKFVPCSEEEYNKMIVPIIDGYEHFCSFGGQPKVDSEDTMLKAGEYTVKDGEVIAYTLDGETGISFRTRDKKDFDKKYEHTI